MSMFIELNPDMKLDEMRKIIKDNSQKAISLSKKIKAMDAVAKKSSEIIEDYDYEFIELVDNDEDEIIDDIEEEEEEYLYYYDNMMEAIKYGEDLKHAIYDNLPVLENGNYGNIILRILLELKNEKRVYEELKEVDPDALEEIKRIDNMDSIIRGHHDVKDEELSTGSNEKNNIIFLKTASGNVYAESDLASIDSEWYPAFKGLIESIENGTFKNVKRLTSNPISQGIPEVKDSGVRVVFDKVGSNTYIILDIFVKKSDHDKGYSNQLINRLAIYRQNEKAIKESVTDELIKNDSIILENIKSGLSSKCIVKSKGGDTNGL